ncbi:hypothetical protein ABZT04_12980 [Streptomyces sp. NPDC005492]|uniref:hypothetical protein n=1 Tax=Streptomyces sp. NPDC005492 TaxID=3156883 RepID=UPI0033A39BE0
MHCLWEDPRPANPLVPLIATGTAPLETLATLALERHHVIPADRTPFLHLAHRATLEAYAAACGIDDLALTSNFAEWGGYCASTGTGGESGGSGACGPGERRMFWSSLPTQAQGTP